MKRENTEDEQNKRAELAGILQSNKIQVANDEQVSGETNFGRPEKIREREST